ncbi:MAG TPA: MBL fold metallo-hydrolase [Microbacterium sp.]|nr:MBL fold metallo-hydrolase [Microbacterium sp.]
MGATRRVWQQVGEGVYRIDRANVNCYVVVTPEGITLVDTGLPGSFPGLQVVLATFGAKPSDIDAVVLTHGHFDHVGMSARLVHDHHVPHFVHDEDRRLARHPYRYDHEAPRAGYLLRYPKAVPVIAEMAAAGALTIKGIEAGGAVRPDRPMDVPGRLVPVWSPGHTYGHCGFSLPGSGILFAGDALVTLDPYTGERGPRIVAKAATADSERALASLDALEATGARTVLTGHGEPWQGGIAAAVQAARSAGAA